MQVQGTHRAYTFQRTAYRLCCHQEGGGPLRFSCRAQTAPRRPQRLAPRRRCQFASRCLRRPWPPRRPRRPRCTLRPRLPRRPRRPRLPRRPRRPQRPRRPRCPRCPHQLHRNPCFERSPACRPLQLLARRRFRCSYRRIEDARSEGADGYLCRCRGRTRQDAGAQAFWERSSMFPCGGGPIWSSLLNLPLSFGGFAGMGVRIPGQGVGVSKIHCY
mmetsp:Transcript_29070/g.62532  ORF Transcript_29070/g.62532 Transcript_29070/m.62532 type:complete len:216 (-) Transcript_29070:27-674(-)